VASHRVGAARGGPAAKATPPARPRAGAAAPSPWLPPSHPSRPGRPARLRLAPRKRPCPRVRVRGSRLPQPSPCPSGAVGQSLIADTGGSGHVGGGLLPSVDVSPATNQRHIPPIGAPLPPPTRSVAAPMAGEPTPVEALANLSEARYV